MQSTEERPRPQHFKLPPAMHTRLLLLLLLPSAARTDIGSMISKEACLLHGPSCPRDRHLRCNSAHLSSRSAAPAKKAPFSSDFYSACEKAETVGGVLPSSDRNWPSCENGLPGARSSSWGGALLVRCRLCKPDRLPNTSLFAVSKGMPPPSKYLL